MNSMTLKLDNKKTTLTNAHTDFEKGLSKYASFKVNNVALSEDLVQDTFIKTWAYLAKGGEILKMKAFLYHVLNGLIIDEYRKRKVTSLDILMENGFEVSFDTTESQNNKFDGVKAVALIGNLPIAYQKIMQMRYVQDLTLDEMSIRTGKSKNSMAVQSHRGLEKLKSLYLLEQHTCKV